MDNPVDNSVDNAAMDNAFMDNQGQIQTIDNISPRKLPQQLPNLDKFANITRPKIAVNCDTQLRKRKLKGLQSKPINKNQVS